MMDLSVSTATLGARQFQAVVGETVAGRVLGGSLRLLRQSAEAARSALPGGAGVEWRELANKLEAFALFHRAPARRGPIAEAGPLLAENLRQVAALGAYPSVWAMEGLGFAVAEWAWAVGESPRRFLAEAGRDVQPAGAVVPLHTGAALSFAERLLTSGEARSPEGLARWLAGWEECALAGSGGVAVEALGLVARNLYPHRLRRLDGLLRAIDPVLAEHLWHGVGRGLYFAPTHLLPYSAAPGRALDKAGREPPDEAGRRNATAGLGWALTLVNLRHPEVVADVLRRHGRDVARGEAFAHGVASAVLLWRDLVGHDPHLTAFLAHRPEAAGPIVGALWRDLVAGPGAAALRSRQPVPRWSGGLAALFRCPPPVREGSGR